METRIESVDCDFYGNPRYIVHFMEFMLDGEELGAWVNDRFPIQEKTYARARALGFNRYRSKKRSGYYVITTWESKRQIAERIQGLLTQTNEE